MGEIELEKYLKNIPQHYTGRLRYDPVSMLKTVLFGFMANGYISLRELEDQCKVNLRFMYLMDHQAHSYRTFGYFINEVLADSIEEIFQDINKKIFETEHVDLQHLYSIMKNDRWYKRIVRRGIKSVLLEVFLVSIGHNLYKYHNKKKKVATAA